jgi:hypothetical protein
MKQTVKAIGQVSNVLHPCFLPVPPNPLKYLAVPLRIGQSLQHACNTEGQRHVLSVFGEFANKKFDRFSHVLRMSAMRWWRLCRRARGD